MGNGPEGESSPSRVVGPVAGGAQGRGRHRVPIPCRKVVNSSLSPRLRLGRCRPAPRAHLGCRASSQGQVGLAGTWARATCSRPVRGHVPPISLGEQPGCSRSSAGRGAARGRVPATTSVMESESAFLRRKQLGSWGPFKLDAGRARSQVAACTPNSQSFQRPTTVQPQVPKPPQCASAPPRLIVPFILLSESVIALVGRKGRGRWIERDCV